MKGIQGLTIWKIFMSICNTTKW